MQVDEIRLEGGGLEAFLAAPHALRREGSAAASAALAERRFLDPRSAFFRHGEVRAFLARAGGEVVARCAAVVNPRVRLDGQPVGLVGFFASVDDSTAAAAVLDAALADLRLRGFERAVGPVQLSIWHSYRLMTDGFERDPFAGEPRNPRWYPPAFERAGFAPLAVWSSWDLDRAALELVRSAIPAEVVEAVEASGLRLEPFPMERFDEGLAALHVVMASAFAGNLCASSIELDEFTEIYEGMRPLIVPELVPFVVDGHGRRVGAGFTYYDPFVVSGPPRVVFHTMALLEHVRGHGAVLGLLGRRLLDRLLATDLERAIGALAKPGRTVYDKTGPATRRYTLYSRAL